MKSEYGDQIIVHFLKDQRGKFDGEHWPLHVTLLPWFSVPDRRHDELADELRIIARRWKSIDVDVEGETMFGRHENIPVTLLGASALRAIHNNLLNTVKLVGGTLRDETFAGAHYRPHVAHDYSQVATTADKLIVDDFSVVEKIDYPHANREVVSTYKLEGIK